MKPQQQSGCIATCDCNPCPIIVNLRMLVINLKLQAEEALGVARENDLSGQASDGDVIGGVNVSKDGVLAL